MTFGYVLTRSHTPGYTCDLSCHVGIPEDNKSQFLPRYVICKGLREDTEDICSFLFFVNEELGRLERTNNDILEVQYSTTCVLK